MASIFTDELMDSEDVAAFLRIHQAAVAFSNVCNLARAAFPELVALDVCIHDDPDETGRSQAVLSAILPPSISDERVQAALAQYHERFIEDVPLAMCPLFALVPEYLSE